MNPMMAAIKRRKSGDGMMSDHMATHGSSIDHGDGEGKDLHGLVASLSQEEKEALKGILDKGQSDNAMNVSKGLPSKEEQLKIKQASDKENQENALEESSDSPQEESLEEQSDDIGKSMLDTAHLRGTASVKPKNLGDRVKQSIVNKLKLKGKM